MTTARRSPLDAFTAPAKRAVVTGQEWARVAGCAETGSEHLLLGLMSTQGGAASAVLAVLGVSVEAQQAAVNLVVPYRQEVARGDRPPLPMTATVRQALVDAVQLAVRLKLPVVGTQHLLHALMQSPTPRLLAAMAELGVTPYAVRETALSRRWPQG